MERVMIVLVVLTSLLIIGVIVLLIRSFKNSFSQVSKEVQLLVQTQLRENRMELNDSLRVNREELSQGINQLTEKLELRFMNISDTSLKSLSENRKELAKALMDFKNSFSESIRDFNGLQRQKFDDLIKNQDKMLVSTEQKLEKMRETVDEKLHKTLEERLGQSFKLVSERLEAVQKGIGEMQTLATGVGDLKKVLTNVKTRGVLGEIQLGNILEQILTPDQYEMNVNTSSRNSGHVEYAIKMPGSSDMSEIYLPIDAKFPQEDYVRLQEAYDSGDLAGIESSKKALVRAVKLFAKDIREKYIDPPNTTDFGIMFLPVEGLYAEIVRQPDLITTLQREFQVAVTGPTTLAAFLNSLQMGFKTLALQRRSSDIHKTLEAVKTQFGLFGSALRKAQERIRMADKDLETLVTTRTNVMLSKLKGLEELPIEESEGLLDIQRDDDVRELP